MRYGFYSYFKPFVTAITDGNKIINIQLEEVHQYNDDESEDVFYLLGYSKSVNEYLCKFVELHTRIELDDDIEAKAMKILAANGFEILD